MRIAFVVGVRPHFIKLGNLYQALSQDNDIELIHTGQHYDPEMSGVFFKQFSLPKPILSLQLSENAKTHARQTSEMMIGVEDVLLKESFDFVVVIGDTNSSLAGALASAKMGIPIIHLEAGVRSNDSRLPEEVNRIVVDRVSKVFLCPTQICIDNLSSEGIKKNVWFVGDLLLDNIFTKHSLMKASTNELFSNLNINSNYIFITLHRQENTDNPENLKNIVTALIDSGNNFVFAAHPRVLNSLRNFNLLRLIQSTSRIKIISPQNSLNCLILQKQADLTLTDSSGIQRESFFLKVPCVIMRNSTEFSESIKYGGGCLAGASTEEIIKSINNYRGKSFEVQYDMFGGGKSCIKIVEAINRAHQTFN